MSIVSEMNGYNYNKYFMICGCRILLCKLGNGIASVNNFKAGNDFPITSFDFKANSSISTIFILLLKIVHI